MLWNHIGRAGLVASRKAVTVWMLSAQTIERYTSGMKIFLFTGLPVYLEYRYQKPTTKFRIR